MKKVLLLACLLWLPVALINAQQADTVKGNFLKKSKYSILFVTVIDEETKKLLPGVMVSPQELRDTLYTNIYGICKFYIKIPDTLHLLIKMPGYDSLLTKEVKITKVGKTKITVKLKYINEYINLGCPGRSLPADETQTVRAWKEEEIKRMPGN